MPATKGLSMAGTVFGNKVSGNDSFVQLKNVKSDPSIEEYEKIKCIIVAIIVDKKYIFVDNVKNITVSVYDSTTLCAY